MQCACTNPGYFAPASSSLSRGGRLVEDLVPFLDRDIHDPRASQLANHPKRKHLDTHAVRGPCAGRECETAVGGCRGRAVLL
jgi:hypothetical protein